MFRLFFPAPLPWSHGPTPGPLDSPKFQRYSMSWKGLAVVLDTVPVVSKKTDNGATPEARLAATDSFIEPADVTTGVLVQAAIGADAGTASAVSRASQVPALPAP